MIRSRSSEKREEVKTPSRVIIDEVNPSIRNGEYPIKRCCLDHVDIKAVVLCDGHDELTVRARYYHESQSDAQETLLLKHNGNDEWLGRFQVSELGTYFFQVEAWIDRFNSWRIKAIKKIAAEQLESSDIIEGIHEIERKLDEFEKASASQTYQQVLRSLQKALEQPKALTELQIALEQPVLIGLTKTMPDATSFQESHIFRVFVEADLARFSSWYEFFPRSMTDGEKRHGTFKDAIKTLAYVHDLGFNIAYIPPIHPIGKQYRKGKNNSTKSQPDDVGSPWAIGSEHGGHFAIHPELGTLAEFKDLIREAKSVGIEVAMDIAFQCSPDHPWVRDHPEWFYQRPDGSIHYAENPPKKYQDIYPLNFENEHWESLCEELTNVFLYWCDQGIRVFRVDNPHTKAFFFWARALPKIRAEFPDAIFLSEAFTRPHRMHWLAKAGFSQSYTYFTWRHSKQEIIEYINELNDPELKEYFRPNFWPNTPDILPSDLRHQPRPSFIKRFILAATLSSNYGIYGPAFELCVNEPMDSHTEEYKDAEKYELKYWPRSLPPGNLGPVIKRINRIRNQHPALQNTGNVIFLETAHDQTIAYLRYNDTYLNYLIVVVNLDSNNSQTCRIQIDKSKIPIKSNEDIQVHELIGDEFFVWHDSSQELTIDPQTMPAKIFHITNIEKPLTDELG